ncbi:hypothetical protein [Biostraticola tofi]|uniref:Uncharacterized protein n=1 Tax=Biostraticola tofi TaxID=466109 RepID=A0A4R3YZI8_9GAMM|nr:hypothetical protein [Biostraticola tofi]TCV98080.1 hypothetical protein EDC52_103165 [Biostraticola tofi]
MKLSIYSHSLLLAASLATCTAWASSVPDMPRNIRTDSACIDKTTAETAGSCPRQVLTSNSQAVKGYSPVYHQD